MTSSKRSSEVHKSPGSKRQLKKWRFCSASWCDKLSKPPEAGIKQKTETKKGFNQSPYFVLPRFDSLEEVVFLGEGPFSRALGAAIGV